MPLTYSFETHRNSYRYSGGCATLARGLGIAGLGVGALALYGGLTAGLGAASGAIGQAVLSAAGWHNTNFNYIRTVQDAAVGNIVVSLIPMGIGTCLTSLGLPQLGLAGTALIAGASGTASTLLGAVMLHRLPSDDSVDAGYGAAAGATGSAILAVGLTVAFTIATVCGVCCVAFTPSGEINLLHIPEENLDHNNQLQSFDGVTIVDAQAVLGSPIPKAEEFLTIVQGKLDRGELDFESKTRAEAAKVRFR